MKHRYGSRQGRIIAGRNETSLMVAYRNGCPGNGSVAGVCVPAPWGISHNFINSHNISHILRCFYERKDTCDANPLHKHGTGRRKVNPLRAKGVVPSSAPAPTGVAARVLLNACIPAMRTLDTNFSRPVLDISTFSTAATNLYAAFRTPATSPASGGG